MSGPENKPAHQLTLRSQLPELALVPPWVDALARQHAIPEKRCFAIQLCLEEALSNIIRHGYRSEPDRTLSITFASSSEAGLSFTIEDCAPPFDPTAPEAMQEPAAPLSLLDLEPGGNGLPLLRKFSDSLRYERLANGNRLTIRFFAAPPLDRSDVASRAPTRR